MMCQMARQLVCQSVALYFAECDAQRASQPGRQLVHQEASLLAAHAAVSDVAQGESVDRDSEAGPEGGPGGGVDTFPADGLLSKKPRTFLIDFLRAFAMTKMGRSVGQ
jgi:hypothetical protein